MRSVSFGLVAAVCGLASVTDAAARFEKQVQQAPEGFRDDFRSVAAKILGKPAPNATAPARRGPVTLPPSVARIRQGLSQMRGLPTDADRAIKAMDLADQIRRLPTGDAKLLMSRSLCNLATEGDLGPEALKSVASILAEGIEEGTPSASDYVTLARLVRYEHVPAPFHDAALDAADALLSLQEAVQQENGFTLTALDGKTYTLEGLRGKVVLLNFWATWCPPCRKEMPDLQKLYSELGPKGIVVLAVSDEARPTVEKFLADKGYTFPILLDPGRKVNTAYNIEGIPKTFIFDRQGKLVTQSIDMRTEAQFRTMLKMAGL